MSRFSWAIVTTALIAVAPAHGNQAAVEQGRASAQRGREAFQRGLYEQALQQFKQAFSTDPRAAYAFSIARVAEKLGKWQIQCKALQDFLRLEAQTDRAQRATADLKLCTARLDREMPEVHIITRPPGVVVVVETDSKKQTAGKTPLRIRMKAGAHRLLLRLPGYFEHSAQIEVAPGAPSRHRFDLASVKTHGLLRLYVPQSGWVATVPGMADVNTPINQGFPLPAGTHAVVFRAGDETLERTAELRPGQEVSMDVVLPAPGDPSALSSLTWATIGLGAAALVTAGIVGVLAIDARSEVESNEKAARDSTGSIDTNDLKQSQDRARALEIGFFAATGVGLAAIGGGLILFEAQEDSKPTALRITTDGTGLTASLRF